MNYKVTCRQCKQTTVIKDLDLDAYLKWRDGELIQRCFPRLSADQRELMISRTCGKCFDAMFAPSEETT